MLVYQSIEKHRVNGDEPLRKFVSSTMAHWAIPVVIEATGVGRVATFYYGAEHLRMQLWRKGRILEDFQEILKVLFEDRLIGSECINNFLETGTAVFIIKYILPRRTPPSNFGSDIEDIIQLPRIPRVISVSF